ncbi:MAG: M1 family aminopeptidase [Sphingopyxis sp.]|uniref:M1 family aminopeptidase n=1 Tax=Sphingopyxis sp. TaxID=1908224 RepID=UPI002AB9808D|nr:M1 family aminopeptidase [Sphingopyxis sp.]MDZ3833773.1 M1 family aminopeptidase [Sphingopyxis sp.]
MRFLIMIGLIFALAGCVTRFGGGEAGRGSDVAATRIPNAVRVLREADGWKAHFHFSDDAAIWAFRRSALLRNGQRPWRPASWEVLTPGVRLERIGDFDAFVARDGIVPRQVTIRFRPLAEDLIADYDPAIILSDGRFALYGGHFSAFPMDARATLAVLSEPADYPTRVAMRASGVPMLFHGQRVLEVDDVGDSYVFIGDVTLTPEDRVATILDPGLPDWIMADLRDYTPNVFRAFADQMGPHKSHRPTIIASWAGTKFKGHSTGGSVSPGLITMRIEGEELLKVTPASLRTMRWFIAHEAAHFWLGETIGYTTPDDAWITEGGADYLAMRFSESTDPHYDAGAFISSARTDCAVSLKKGSLAEARRRGDQRAYYACGTLFALAVDRAGRGRGETYHDFVRGLIESDADRKVTSAEWFAAARKFGVAGPAIARMHALVAGTPDAAAAIDALMAVDVQPTSSVSALAIAATEVGA